MTGQAHYTIGKLAEAAATTPRTIRYYTTEKLLPPPLTGGRCALYTEAHCNRLRLIQRLKNAFLPLEAIRNQIAALTDAQVESLLADSADVPEDVAKSESEKRLHLQIHATEPHSGRSAADYVAQILAVSGQTRANEAETPKAPKSKRALLVSPIFRPTEPAAGVPSVEAAREVWERIPLGDGAELHVRLPAEPLEREFLERQIVAAQAAFTAEKERKA